MRMRAGSQPGCALLGLPLALWVSGHSSLQLCQLGAVALLSPVVGGASIAPHDCHSVWSAGPTPDLTTRPQLELHYPPPPTQPPEGVVRILVKSWIGMS